MISKEAFVGLPQSTKINLASNRCVDENLQNRISAAAAADEWCQPHDDNEIEQEEPEDESDSDSKNKVSCVETAFENWFNVYWQKTCFMNHSTAIDTPTYQISSKDSAITALTFAQNDDISYLPIGLHRIFPDLVVIDATDCSLVKISHENFKGLTELSQLWLRSNMITAIDGDTFKGLIHLACLDLSE